MGKFQATIWEYSNDIFIGAKSGSHMGITSLQ